MDFLVRFFDRFLNRIFDRFFGQIFWNILLQRRRVCFAACAVNFCTCDVNFVNFCTYDVNFQHLRCKFNYSTPAIFVKVYLQFRIFSSFSPFHNNNLPILSVLDGFMLGMFLKAFQRLHRALLS